MLFYVWDGRKVWKNWAKSETPKLKRDRIDLEWLFRQLWSDFKNFQSFDTNWTLFSDFSSYFWNIWNNWCHFSYKFRICWENKSKNWYSTHPNLLNHSTKLQSNCDSLLPAKNSRPKKCKEWKQHPGVQLASSYQNFYIEYRDEDNSRNTTRLLSFLVKLTLSANVSVLCSRPTIWYS